MVSVILWSFVANSHENSADLSQSVPFIFENALNKKTAVEHFQSKAFIRQGREEGLTTDAEIIRKGLLHLTNNSHFIIT